MLDEPLTPADARALIRAIIKTGVLSYSKHARDEMKVDNVSALDVTNVLRGGAVEPGELENGSWRYRVRTNLIRPIYVCVAFRSETSLVVVTVWRKKP